MDPVRPLPRGFSTPGLPVKAAWLAGSHDRAGKLAHGLRCAPTAYAADSDCIAADGVSGIAPLTRCRGGDVVPYSDVWHCAATAFAGAAPLARCSRIALLLNVIPPYYTCFTKHAAFHQVSATLFGGAPRRFEVVDMTAGSSGDRSHAVGRRRRACPCGAACAPRLVVALVGGQPRRSRPDRCVSPCPPASCTPRRWTPAPNSSRRNILRPRFRRSHPPAAGQAMRRTRLTVRPFSSSRSGILPTKSTRCGAARCASRCSPETQFS